jgi:hypothetical protein
MRRQGLSGYPVQPHCSQIQARQTNRSAYLMACHDALILVREKDAPKGAHIRLLRSHLFKLDGHLKEKPAERWAPWRAGSHWTRLTSVTVLITPLASVAEK